MRKKQIFTISHGTYDFDILVAVGLSHKEICDYIEKKKKYKLNDKEREMLEMTGRGKTTFLRCAATVLQVERLKDPSQFWATVQHEMFHVVEFLFDHIGLKYDIATSSEAFAYQIGHLTKEFYRKLK